MTVIDRQRAAPNEGSSTRFDEGWLRRRAGDTTFARGRAYFRGGQVQLLLIGPGQVLARVQGSRPYRVELTGRGSRTAGRCSCPAFVDLAFCKHMVATALAANAAGETEEVGGALVRIRDHLRRQTVDGLVEIVLDLAARDAALFRKLELAALAAAADGGSEGLAAAIDAATEVPEFDEEFDPQAWEEGVEGVLEAVAGLLAKGKAELALALAVRAADRIAGADDDLAQYEGGYGCEALIERAFEIHLEAAEQARPAPVAFARELFALETRPDGASFEGAAETYAEVLGERGLAEYRRLAVEAWDALHASGATAAERRAAPDFDRLQAIIDYFAERAGDVDARIALRAEDLSTPDRYLQLARFCLEQGRKEEALRRVEEGLWLFEDQPPDERFVRFAAGLLAEAGRRDEAVAHLWRLFEKAPASGLYGELRAIGGEPVRDRCIACLAARLPTNERLGWYAPADFLVEILMRETMFEAAWAVVRDHKVTARVQEALALASEKTHPREAIAVYTGRIEALVTQGGDLNYSEAVELLRRMAGLRSAGEQAAHVAALKLHHARRRNFLKLLG
jgi:tetratricopeptide (TPR) repeat protein